MKCKNCREEIPSGKKFCGYCGTRIQEPIVIHSDVVFEPVINEEETMESVSSEEASQVQVAPKKIRSHTQRKWLYWSVPILLIVVGLVLAVLFNWIPRQVIWSLIPKAQSPEETTEVQGGLSIMVAGEWVGEIGEEDWSATIEIVIDEYCDIGSICGTYRVLNGSRGELELVEVLGFGYRFLEHPIGTENVPGPGFQTMSLSTLEHQKLNWSFRQELPSGDILISSGILNHK